MGGTGRLLAAFSLILFLAACPQKGEDAGGPPPAAEPPVKPEPPPPEPKGMPADEAFVNTGLRCSECHSRLHEQWSTSAHATSKSGAAYQAYIKVAPDEEETCDECHAPIAGKVRDVEHVVQDGVNCDVCHTIAKVDVGAHRAEFEMRLTEPVRYGPICDAEDHYFHRMGCSPLHGTAELCASCHLYERKVAGGSVLPVITEYREWKEGPYAAEGIQCPSCHMPDDKAEVATGADARTDVSHHGFLGREGDMRERALTGAAQVAVVEEGLHVEVELTNAGAGHAVPSGLPGRQIVVRATMKGKDAGQPVVVERAYGRVLVDASGGEVPFMKAVEVGSDTRILPDETRKEVLALTGAPEEGEVLVEILWRSLSPALSQATGVEAEERMLFTGTAKFGKPRPNGRRPGLPKKLRVGG